VNDHLVPSDDVQGAVIRWPRERLAELLTAAAYGTVLILAALPFISVEQVRDGVGWELLTGVGLATWVAHLYAQAVGDHVRSGSSLDGAEIRTAMVNGLPILLATFPPAFMLLLGRLDVLDANVARWAAVGAATVQLVGVGIYVGRIVSSTRARSWTYALATALLGGAVVGLELILH
jgi:hypothetical protein